MVTRVNEIWRLLEEMQGQIAAEIRVMLGEPPIDSSNFTEEDKQRRIRAMKECAARSTSDEERHDAWIKMHVDSGWVYGEEFNSEKKTHPNLKPWDELPATVRAKARIFDIVSKAGAKIALEERDPNDADACTSAMVNGVATFHDMMTREADRVLSKAAEIGGGSAAVE